MGQTRAPIRVVIATASPTVREMLRMHLECLGCSVIAEAVNASQALNLFRSAKPELVMVDTAVPALNGIDSMTLLRAAHDESPGTTLIVVVSDPADPIAARLAQNVSHNFAIDPGDTKCFERMWRGLAEIYPELRRPSPGFAP